MQPAPVMPTIAIIGAGLSGSLLATHLLSAPTRCRVLLFERRTAPGRGLAYGTHDDNLVLNVPAGNMGLFPDKPAHFLRYCQNLDPAFSSGSFVSRRIFGDYIEDTLSRARAANPEALETVQGEVCGVHPHDNEFDIALDDGRSFRADRVVLALGHLGSQRLPVPTGIAGTPRYVPDPWAAGALDKLDPELPVAIIGTGHTAIDTVFRLSVAHPKRRIVMISRRGLLPNAHRSRPQVPAAAAYPAWLPDKPSAFALLRAVRAETRLRTQNGGDWRDVLNELRPYTPDIWLALPVHERRRFLNRIRPFWDVHRHRLSPCADHRLARLLAQQRVEVFGARISRFHTRPDSIELTLSLRNGGTHTRQVGSIVNCTGPDYDIGAIDSPLVRQLRDDGLIRPDPLKIGIDVDDTYAPLGRDGKTQPGLYYLGPMLRAKYWEAIAVPELRIHAGRLTAHITANQDCCFSNGGTRQTESVAAPDASAHAEARRESSSS